ncbi:uncharacterized protein LOC126842847 [Adelges cooleyi]|uniref:uncharacterized protein LOC126842847 n=1 Tax=Adelges cooleyi TaxID=133065 RepID=UPI0021800357|nr:uncharacterized protein LOC126842847 [Adelges cooleyi]
MSKEKESITLLNIRSMDELNSEDSYDGTLVIDEKIIDYETIELSDDSDAELGMADFNDIKVISSSSESSTDTDQSLTCSHCSKLFSDKESLYNHISTYQGGCNTELYKNVKKRRKGQEPKAKPAIVKKGRKRSPKNFFFNDVPKAIPLGSQTSPIMSNQNPTNESSMPSLRQILIEEIEPEYPCSVCGQVFRHNIALIFHSNTVHKEVDGEDISTKQKPINKMVRKKKNCKDSVIKPQKTVEVSEPISDKIDLTLLPDFKKDTVINRIKSYIHSSSKDQAICILCNVDFKTTKKAMAHVEDKHILEKFECGYCNMKFVYELKLRSHMAKRHKVIVVDRCIKCLKMISKEECESHLNKCKGNEKVLQIKKETDQSVTNEN